MSGKGQQKDKLINIFKSASVHQALKKEWRTGENPNKGNICTEKQFTLIAIFSSPLANILGICD